MPIVFIKGVDYAVTKPEMREVTNMLDFLQFDKVHAQRRSEIWLMHPDAVTVARRKAVVLALGLNTATQAA